MLSQGSSLLWPGLYLTFFLLQNLLQNAVEAMPQGGELAINASSKGDFLDVAISDAGHGIAENIMDKIFLPFFTTKENGTGLGLAIVHKIVVSHGGNIFVDSSDKGTLFRIRFPLEFQRISGNPRTSL